MLTGTANMKLLGINDLVYCGVSDRSQKESVQQVEFKLLLTMKGRAY
jgi:hypothetical protein